MSVVKINRFYLKYLTIGVLYLPVVIFLITFVKRWIGVPVIACLLVVFITTVIKDGLCCAGTSNKKPQAYFNLFNFDATADCYVELNIAMMIICVTMLCVIGLISGWGVFSTAIRLEQA